MIRALHIIAAGALAISVVQAGCGPSLRRTYQSDNAFATCFAADYEPSVDAGEKKACWRSWLDGHVYNQPPDKIAYAELRLEELEEGVSIPGPPGPPGRFHERPELPQGQPAAPAGEEAADDCEEICRSTLESCEALCDTDGEKAQRCMDACAAGYAGCRKSCGTGGP